MNRLKEVRAIKRIIQFQLSIATGIQPSKISLIENGFIQPREDEIEKLSNALGVKSEEIFPKIEESNERTA